MSAYERFLFTGFKLLNFSLKVFIEMGSFMRVSTVYTYVCGDRSDMISLAQSFIVKTTTGILIILPGHHYMIKSKIMIVIQPVNRSTEIRFTSEFAAFHVTKQPQPATNRLDHDFSSN